MGIYVKAPKMSYSKANTYEQCPWKYYLTYVLGNYFFTDNIASEFGTLVHFIEQTIFNTIKEGKEIDYEKMKEDFQNINIPKKDKWDTEGGIFGINILKEKYKKDFYEPDSMGQSFYSRSLDYMAIGMYRLEKYLKDNPQLTPFAAEKYFSITLDGYVFSGHIDRIFYDTSSDTYIIEDIKTKTKSFKDNELTTPLQFLIYCVGLHESLEIEYENMSCKYDLPFLNMKQDAGTKGFIKRGLTKMHKILESINQHMWEPSPSPLCYYCSYCNQNPNQPEGAENLCPYYCQWTPDDKTLEVVYKWEGMDNHSQVLERFKSNYGKNIKITDEFDFEF